MSLASDLLVIRRGDDRNDAASRRIFAFIVECERAGNAAPLRLITDQKFAARILAANQKISYDAARRQQLAKSKTEIRQVLAAIRMAGIDATEPNRAALRALLPKIAAAQWINVEPDQEWYNLDHSLRQQRYRINRLGIK